MPILADYFIVVSVPPDEANIEVDDIEPTILYRYPEQDHKKHRFPENAPFFCFPEGARIEYRDKEMRKPFFFTFCFTVEDGSRSYGTTLYYFEPLKINGENKLNSEGKQLFVPKALCLLSHQPMFSAFAIFLRELYRNAITVTEDVIGDDVSRTRKSSFNSKLRKGSTCNIVDDISVVDCPIERQIRYFIDYCPSLDASLKINLVVFQKLIEIIMPPQHCLPFTDKLCFDSLFNSLSARNIVKVVSCLLQEQRVLLVSTQMDTLTLCAEAFISLLYPFNWMHPLVPLLPTQLIEYLEAPTPYLMGVTSSVYESDDCQSVIDGVTIVQLDFDKVHIPKELKVEQFPKAFVKKMEKFFSQHIPPPSTRILYCDSMNPMRAAYLVFEVMFGPGKLGIKMKARKQCLTENEEKIEVVYLENVPDEDITIVGPGKKVALLRREPVILAVNGVSVTGQPLKSVVQTISKAARPLTMRLQIGCAPASTGNNMYASYTGSALAPIAEGVSEPTTPELGDDDKNLKDIDKSSSGGSYSISPSEIMLEENETIPSPMLRRSISPRYSGYEEEDGVVRRYYRERSKRNLLSEESEEGEEDMNIEAEEEKRLCFNEQVRTYFLLEMCELLDGYEKYIREDEVDPEHVFNTKSFLKHVNEDYKPFLKLICKTQMFSHFIHDAYEYDDNYEVQVFDDAMKLRAELGDYTDDYVIESLAPSKWERREINVPPCDLRGLPEGWEALVFQRDPELFPALDPQLFGETLKRMKVEPLADHKEYSFVPDDLKALRKELKAKAKAKAEKRD